MTSLAVSASCLVAWRYKNNIVQFLLAALDELRCKNDTAIGLGGERPPCIDEGADGKCRVSSPPIAGG